MKKPDDWDAMHKCAPFDPPGPQPGGSLFQMVHPQWGGYCFPCVVQFYTDNGHRGGDATRVDLPCFDVYEFHNGEFPRDEVETVRHYCAAEQIVDFGLAIIELQVKHCEPFTTPSIPWLEENVARLNVLLERAKKMEEEHG